MGGLKMRPNDGVVDGAIMASEMWQTTSGDNNVLIAVVDRTVHYGHRDVMEKCGKTQAKFP